MLDNLNNKKIPFTVPDNYFEDFNSGIMNMLPEKETKPINKIIPFWKKTITWVGVAAVFSGIILTTGLLNHNSSSELSNPQNISNEKMSNIDENEFLMYLEDEVASSSMYREAAFSE